MSPCLRDLPECQERGSVLRAGIAGDGDAMLPVERLLEELGAAFPTAREHHAHAVQIVVGSDAGPAHLQLDKTMPQLGRAEARADNGAMQVCIDSQIRVRRAPCADVPLWSCWPGSILCPSPGPLTISSVRASRDVNDGVCGTLVRSLSGKSSAMTALYFYEYIDDVKCRADREWSYLGR